jgi:transposase
MNSPVLGPRVWYGSSRWCWTRSGLNTAPAGSSGRCVFDLDRRRVVEVFDGRSRRRMQRYLRSVPERHRKAIEVVSIDPYEAYRRAIRAELPWARMGAGTASPL